MHLRECVSSAFVGAFAVALLLSLAQPAAATFPGANGKIAFSGCGPVDCGVFVMNSDGSNPTQITHNTTLFCGHGICTQGTDEFPAWSPDGQKIAYGSLLPGSEGRQIFVVNADGGAPKQLTRKGSENSSPTWSPDGRKIAFSSNLRGFRDIYVMNSSGGGQKRLTRNDVHDDAPDWSPDGQKIAFQRLVGTEEIYVMDPNGRGETQLTFSDPSNPFDSGSPSWSPDNAKIAFNSDTTVNVMNADGGGRTFVTSGCCPAWSPDGQKVAYSSGGMISVVNTDGTNSVQLAAGTQPAWQSLQPAFK
jgi:Tol biopolymer transport system component